MSAPSRPHDPNQAAFAQQQPSEPAPKSAPTLEALQLRDLETYVHRHEILASFAVPEAVSESPGRTEQQPAPTAITLCDWRHESPSRPAARVDVPLADPGEALAVVRGFADWGVVCLPGDQRDTAAALCAAAAAQQARAPAGGSEAPLPSLPDLVRRFSVTGAEQWAAEPLVKPPSEAKTVKLWSFSVYSERPDDVFAGGLVPVWKWLKPTSPYNPKSGLWQAELAPALEDGAWLGGKELVLLVHGVTEQAWQVVAGQKSSRLPDNTDRAP